MIFKRKLIELKLGETYVINWGEENKPPRIICKFIKVTRCGYNFLDLNTNSCILRHHLYPSKYPEHKLNSIFFINPYLFARKMNK